MRLEERRTLKLVLALGLIAALVPALYLTFLLFFGLRQAPRPVAETTPAPPLIAAALWARAEGGQNTELRSINPITVAGFASCTVLANLTDETGRHTDNRGEECSHWLPALRAVEYLGNLHLRDNHVERASFRGGAGNMAMTLVITHSWNREQLLNTLAARADFGYGWRGVDAAAPGFFGRPAAALTLPEAAFLAARVGDIRSDPWCEPDVATAMRNRVLETMRNNQAIPDTQYQQAVAVRLELVSPPALSRCG